MIRTARLAAAGKGLQSLSIRLSHYPELSRGAVLLHVATAVVPLRGKVADNPKRDFPLWVSLLYVCFAKIRFYFGTVNYIVNKMKHPVVNERNEQE